MITLLIAAFSGAVGIILSKIILTRRHLSVHIFSPLLFLFLFLVTAIVVPWIGRVDLRQALQPIPALLFLAMVVIAAGWNVFYYRAIKNESLQEFEIVILLVPLATVLISGIALPEERNLHLLVATMVASVALLISHVEKRHLEFTRYSRWLVVAVALIALESIVIKQLLTIWSPAALYLARTFFVFLFFSLLVGPQFQHLTAKSVMLTFAAAVSGVVYMVTKFYGYQVVGIVYTTLVLVLEPVFLLALDKLVLKEKLQPKYLVAVAVIIAAVIYGTLAR